MKKLLKRLLKYLAYTAAGIVILLAVAVGLFRLFLPRLPEYQEEIKSWVSSVIGVSVEFSGMDARWGFSGPELEFYDAELTLPDSAARLAAAGKVSISVDLVRLLLDRRLIVDQVVVRDTTLELRRLESGKWWLQGRPLDELPRPRGRPGGPGRMEVIGEDIEVRFLGPGDERPRLFEIPRVLVRRDEARLAIDATIEPPAELGDGLHVAATQIVPADGTSQSWDVLIEIDDVRLPGVTGLGPEELPAFKSGHGDIQVSFAYADREIRSATANLELEKILIEGGAEFDANARLEYQRNVDGWLVAANRLRLTTPNGAWPQSSVYVATSTDPAGDVVTLDVRASYLNLDDYGILLPVLDESQRRQLTDFDPSGRVRDLEAKLTDRNTDAPGFDVSVSLSDVGLAASGGRPGIRGFTGALRADRSGGRLELRGTDMLVSLPEYLPDSVPVDTALGTIIWRRGNDRTTVLSDNIEISNADFQSASNVEVILGAAGSRPVVDVATSFSINDLGTAEKYIPLKPVKEKTRQWFRNALRAGRVPSGTLRLSGPLDKFPFESGEGRLLVNASIRDAVLQFAPRWPATEVASAEMTIDNLRLLSERNRSQSLGIRVENARIEIEDLRQPVLTLQTAATGSLESLRQFAMESPIGRGIRPHLERLDVSGDAALTIDLVVPIREWRSYQVTSRLQTSNGSVSHEGFGSAMTGISGVVTVTREDIESEGLGGTFLGRPVAIELLPARASLPGYRIIAEARGTAPAAALVGELRIPLPDLLEGEAAYRAELRFPRGRVDTPEPFAIAVESDLVGIGIDLPVPFKKRADAAMPISGMVRFPRGGQRIESDGSVADLMAWQLAFVHEVTGWDFDRGVLTFGADPVVDTDAAATRGLHLRGSAEQVRLQDWLDLSRRDAAKTGAADRIRSIDMTVTDLYVFGQHIENHRVRVDRSARDWLVQFDGDDVSGSVFVPYDLASGRALVLDMDRLRLPGDEETEGQDGAQADPRSLPPMSVKASEFAFGERYFGAVEAEVRRSDRGLVAEKLLAADDSFDIVGSGRWLVDDSDPLGHRTFVTATLTSRDIKRTMERLDYSPGILGNDMAMLLDLSWSGGPRADFLDTLDGEVTVRLGSGELDEVDPGAGRMFGLMSIVALPRRLALDFRDVFAKGFSFDKITGTFRIVDGEAYTCDLSLVAPAAEIGLVGRANLVERDYDQVAIINANFGNALPVVGAVVAGPQAAAVMLIFSQIFKKPLQEMSQVYYAVSGSWDDPTMVSADAESFAARGRSSGCFEQSD